jgi:hypothetical protein
MIESEKPDPLELVENVKNKENEKFDYFLPDGLLNLEYHNRFIALVDTLEYLEQLRQS